MTHYRTSRWETLGRLAIVLASFGLVTGSALFGLYGLLEALEVARQPMSLNTVEAVELHLQHLTRPGPRRMQRVAWLGDSSLRTQPGQTPTGRQLQSAVRRHTRGRPPVLVRAFALPGYSAFDYYFRSQAIVDAAPDQVLLVLNPATLGDGWLSRFRRPEMSGWIPPRRVPEALTLPLSRIGLTMDRLLFAVGVVQLGGGGPWIWLQGQQGRANVARDDLARRLAGLTGTASLEAFATAAWIESMNETAMEDGTRWNATGARPQYGPFLAGVGPDHPVLRMLAATLRIFRDAGLYVRVYVNPINVEHLRRIGLYDAAGLRRSLDSIEAVVTQNGANLTDLHDILPDEGFRDPAGHFAWEGDYDGFGVLVDALAGPVARQARVAIGRGD